MTLLGGLLRQSLLNRYPDHDDGSDDDRDDDGDDDRDDDGDDDRCVYENQTVQSVEPKRKKTAQILPSSGCHNQSK